MQFPAVPHPIVTIRHSSPVRHLRWSHVTPQAAVPGWHAHFPELASHEHTKACPPASQ